MLTKDILGQLPNCRLISTASQTEDEAEWLAVRTKGIGGSDIGAICGVSPFASAKQIYFKKTGQYEEYLTPAGASIERMHFGHMLEPVVANEYALRTGNKLLDINCTLCHKDYPWARANIDRLIVDVNDKPIGVLECKTTSEYNNDDWDEGEILESYIYQLNWYLWILGLEHGSFACLVGGNKFYHYDVYRNDELINDIMLPAAKSFWFDNVLKLVEPEMQAVDTEFVKTVYGDCIKGSEKVFEDDLVNDMLATVVDCKAKIKELEKIKEETENQVKDRLKETEIGYTKDYVVKWSPRSQTRVDTDKLKMTFPEIYDQVKKQIYFRVMNIKGGSN